MINPNRSSSRYSVHAGESSVTTKSSEETIENTIMYSHTALSHCDIIATQNGEVQRQVRYIKCKSAAHGFGMTQLSPSFNARDQLSTSGARRTFDEFIIPTVLGEKRVLPIHQRPEKNKKPFIIEMLLRWPDCKRRSFSARRTFHSNCGGGIEQS